MQPLAEVPAVVAALGDQVDLLVQVLADVGGPELAGLAVERHAPDVAQAIGPDLGTGVRPADERIVLRNGVVLAAFAVVDVDAENLAEQRPEILAVVVRVVAGAAVAVRDVEEPSGPKQIVPPSWFQNGFLKRRISSSEAGSAWFGSSLLTRNRETTFVSLPPSRVEDEELAVLLESGGTPGRGSLPRWFCRCR